MSHLSKNYYICLLNFIFTNNPLSDDAARMCTDIASADVIEHMQLCHRLMPRDWGSEEASLLCEHTVSRVQVEAALRCAVESTTRYVFLVSGGL